MTKQGVITFGKELHIYFYENVEIHGVKFDENKFDSVYDFVTQVLASHEGQLVPFFNGKYNCYINVSKILYIKDYQEPKIQVIERTF